MGHVFRDKSPYTFPGGVAKIVLHNAARVAEVRKFICFSFLMTNLRTETNFRFLLTQFFFSARSNVPCAKIGVAR